MKGSIRRRGTNSWELTLDLGRDPQGRRQRKYVNVKGKKADAERQLRELLVRYDKGIPLDTGKTTVSEYFDQRHETYVVPNTRPRTAEGYEGIIGTT